MSADVAGYSRLMGKDETGTLSAMSGGNAGAGGAPPTHGSAANASPFRARPVPLNSIENADTLQFIEYADDVRVDGFGVTLLKGFAKGLGEYVQLLVALGRLGRGSLHPR